MPGDALRLAGEALQDRIRFAWMSPAEYEQLASAVIIAFLRAQADNVRGGAKLAAHVLDSQADLLDARITAALGADHE